MTSFGSSLEARRPPRFCRKLASALGAAHGLLRIMAEDRGTRRRREHRPGDGEAAPPWLRVPGALLRCVSTAAGDGDCPGDDVHIQGGSPPPIRHRVAPPSADAGDPGVDRGQGLRPDEAHGRPMNTSDLIYDWNKNFPPGLKPPGPVLLNEEEPARRAAITFGARSFDRREDRDSSSDGGARDQLPRSRAARSGAAGRTC